MLQINKTVIAGALGADPEMRFMPNGDAVCNIRVATTESWKDKASGEKREATEWHSVVFFRKQAEIIGQYFKKGSGIYVEGKLKTRKWQDKEGRDQYKTEIHGDEFQFTDRKPGGNDSESTGYTPSQAPRNQASRQPAAKQPFNADEIPNF